MATTPVRPCKRKLCLKCGREYQSTGRCQKFCAECAPTAAERTAQWRIEHPEQAKASRDVWDLAHSEKMKEYQREYNLSYAPLHRHERVVSVRRWQKKNPERVSEMGRKSRFGRRTLGFVRLNQPFAGSNAHHVNQEYVIYIPKELHQSVHHNVWTGKNMEKINKLAFAYLGGN